MVKTNWRYSEEKKILKHDIENAVVLPSMTATQVYEMHDGIYKKYQLQNFKNNLTNLRDVIEKGKKKARNKRKMLANTLNGKEDKYNAPGKTWQSSEARKTLLLDIHSGVTANMTPKQIYESRTVYQAYDLTKFRNNLNKEKYKLAAKQQAATGRM
jgi:hypothetical protein